MNKIKKYVERVVKDFLSEYYKKYTNLNIIDLISHPPKQKLGDFSLTLPFLLAKKTKKTPHFIGEQLVSFLINSQCFSHVEFQHPGYVNISLKWDTLYDYVNFNPFKSLIPLKKKYYIEYISANPTGVLHLGHMRIGLASRIYGKLLEFLGCEVKKEFLVNNNGVQIDKILESCKFLINSNFKNNKVIYYSKELKNYTLERYKKKLAPTKTSLVNYFLKEIKKDMELLKINTKNITFINENVFTNKEKTQIFYEKLIKKNICYELKDAIYLKTSILGDIEDRVVVKSNGYRTYVGTDILYHLYKFKNPCDIYLNFWGSDQQGNESTLRYGLKLLKNKEEKKLKICYSQLVHLKENGELKKISKRKGISINIRSLKNTIDLDTLSHYLMHKSLDTSIVIDLDELKKKNKMNTLYYLQYSYARIYQLLLKGNKHLTNMKEKQIDLKKELQFSYNERKLILLSYSCLDVLYEVVNTYSIHKLYRYLYELCETFHKYYQNEKIIKKESSYLIINNKLNIVKLIQRTISIMFEILDIKKLNRME